MIPLTSLGPRIIVVFDFAQREQALNLASQLDPKRCRLKIGKEMFTRYGPQLVTELQSKGFEIFLDLKFHDIPNTVARACRAAAELGVWMVDVHALGGEAMLAAAREGLDSAPVKQKPLLAAVTILTSLTAQDLANLGFNSALQDLVMRLAQLACQQGAEGIICSAQEAALLRQKLGHTVCLITPGIRPAGFAQHDQQRTLTPAAAIQAGVDYLVIGRPITQSSQPLAVLDLIEQELAKAALTPQLRVGESK